MVLWKFVAASDAFKVPESSFQILGAAIVKAAEKTAETVMFPL